MLEQVIINQYLAAIEFYKVDTKELSDIVLALVISDNLDGTNKRELDVDRLCNQNCFLTEVLDLPISRVPASILPDVQLYRLMCDSLYLYLKSKGIEVESTHLTSGASCKVASCLGFSEVSQGYSDELECKRILDLFDRNARSGDFYILTNVIKDCVSKSTYYINLENRNSKLFGVKDLVLPDSIRYDVRACKTETMKFVSTKEFMGHMSKLKIETIQDYCSYIKLYWFISGMQNIVIQLQNVFKRDRGMFCTLSLASKRELNKRGIFSLCCNNNYGLQLIADRGCMDDSLFRNGMEELFDLGGMLDLSGIDELLQIAFVISSVIERWDKLCHLR